MSKPHTNQSCEICNSITPKILIDGRVKQGPHGPKGHWVYMCETCHLEWGIGFDKENYIKYERNFGRYFEVGRGESDVSKENNSLRQLQAGEERS